MRVELRDCKGVRGGRSLVLIDDDGQPLPNQVHTRVDCPSGGDFPTITVTFVIDGDRIAMVVPGA